MAVREMGIRRSWSLHRAVVAQTAGLLAILTAMFLLLVLSRMERRAEEAGLASFTVVAEHAVDEIHAVFQNYLSYLGIVTALEGNIWASDPTRLGDGHALARTLLQDGGPTSVLLARPNDDFMIVERSRADMLPGASYSITVIRNGKNGTRTRAVSFHAADTSQLSQAAMTTDYRPTSRDWYREAARKSQSYLSAPYQFGNRQEYGLTLSLAPPGGRGVIAVSMGVDNFERVLEKLRLSANAIAAVVDSRGIIMALRARGKMWQSIEHSSTNPSNLQGTGNAILAEAVSAIMSQELNAPHMLNLKGHSYFGSLQDLEPSPGTKYQVLLIAPVNDFTGAIEVAKRDTWLVAAAALFLVFPLVWLGSKRVSSALNRLVIDVDRVRRLDFSPPKLPIRSLIHEVDVLAGAHDVMRSSLNKRTEDLKHTQAQLEKLIETGINLIVEHDRDCMLKAIVNSAREVTACDAVLIYVRDDEDNLRPTAKTGVIQSLELPDYRITALDDPSCTLAIYTAVTGDTSVINDFASDTRRELRNCRILYSTIGLDAQTLLSVPLQRPDGYVLGVMQLFNARDTASKEVVHFSQRSTAIVQALAAQAAVALENNHLIASQRQVMDALVLMLARAVDAKSPHTGAHCQRVPELAAMLAEAAHRCTDGTLADFGFHREEQWHEFRIGAWLHDCGKLATPEHVIDKATKLETVYNRIHEIRTRFEVVLRDRRIEALEAVLSGTLGVTEADAQFSSHAAALIEDFAFVAQCNIGGEEMIPEYADRLREIAAKRWLRHFDDRLGLSIAEQQLRDPAPLAHMSPVEEMLIADKPWHMAPRVAGEAENLTKGFEMEVPANRYNHGELYNLCISRGTLTSEERFKINEHVIQTIRMLEGIPFPKNLRRVPEFAGTHHEMLDGTGYPRRLSAAQLSIPARIMTIADIFEALTASDRPYRKANTLSQSLRILYGMKVSGRIDPDLFDLFLRDGVYLRYAQRFLKGEQLDVVDVAQFL